MVQVAIYCRVSTDDQHCDRQERDLTAYCSKLGYNIVSIHRETASGAKNDRKERAAVMKLAQARKIDAIVVTELTRWGRSTMDLLETLEELKAKGVSVIAQTGIQFDLNTPQGKLLTTLLASLSEFERDLLRERTRSGIAAARARGKQIGRAAGDNYKVGKLVSKVSKLKSEGKSIRTIASELKVSPTSVVKALKLSATKG